MKKVIVQWNEDTERVATLIRGTLEEGPILLEFSPGDASYFEKHGDLWYEEGGEEYGPVNIQEEKLP